MSMPPLKQKDNELYVENDLNNYKGIYFGGDNEQTYFEAGAHFKYKDLCAKLEKLVMSLTPDRRGKTMYEDGFPKRKETNSIDRTKAESRKIGSECSKSTNSAPKSSHISPNTVWERNKEVVSRNKKHNVSQDRQSSLGKHSVQGKIVINTIKSNKIAPNNINNIQYIKKVNPNFVNSNNIKTKENKFNFVEVKKSMKARILEITEKESFSQQKVQANISSIKINNLHPISSKNTNDSISSRKFYTYNQGSYLSKKAENSRVTIEKSFKQSVDLSTPSDVKPDSKRKNELLNSNQLKSRNIGKFDLFKSANKENKIMKNYSIDNGNSTGKFKSKGLSPILISKTLNKISPSKTHFSQYNKAVLKEKKLMSPLIKNKLLTGQGNISFLKESFKVTNLSSSQKKERTKSVNVKKVFTTTNYGITNKKIK